MIKKRFSQMCASNDYCIGWDNKLDEGLSIDDTIEMLNKLSEENEQLQHKIDDLLYQIGYVNKNNKSCDRCECFIEDIGYCWMWDMDVKKEDIVVACDKRKVIE